MSNEAGGWRSMDTAPKDGTEFLAWFQKHKLDDDGDSTEEVVGGAQAIISYTPANGWDEPQWLDAHGAWYMDDWCFADEPVLWHPLPPNPTVPAGVQASQCWCLTCRPLGPDRMEMVVCPECGCKRCPHAENHASACTGQTRPFPEGHTCSGCIENRARLDALVKGNAGVEGSKP